VSRSFSGVLVGFRPARHHGRVQRIELDGVRVEYELTGEGEPVVLPHARPFVMWHLPLVAELRDVSVLRYRREAPAGWRVEDDARLCARLLRALGIRRVHVIGHSYGGLVALELARRGEADLRSLALLEPATIGLLPPDEADARTAPLVKMARAEGASTAMDRFLRVITGPEGPEVLDKLVPGALTDALSHAAGFFTVELPAAARWMFAPSDATTIGLPVLHLRGAASAPRFAEGAALVESWFPAAEHRMLDGVDHLMMTRVPEATAALLDRFWRSA
jgi:pimeloyl-ACP methyl ester carboxylesterase